MDRMERYIIHRMCDGLVSRPLFVLAMAAEGEIVAVLDCKCGKQLKAITHVLCSSTTELARRLSPRNGEAKSVIPDSHSSVYGTYSKAIYGARSETGYHSGCQIQGRQPGLNLKVKKDPFS